MITFEAAMRSVGGEAGIIRCMEAGNTAPLKIVLQAARDEFDVRERVRVAFNVDQAARDLLSAALNDGLVCVDTNAFDNPDPQARNTGELVGVANILSSMVNQKIASAVQEAMSCKR